MLKRREADAAAEAAAQFAREKEEASAREAAEKAALPEALAVEMEGAAIAQVCYEHDVPCAVVRTVSDTADAHAPESFLEFLHALGGAYSSGILRRFLAARA